MKWRTYFPFIIKLYGLAVKTTCFGVNCIWVWFETNWTLWESISLPLKPGNHGACLTVLWWGLYDKTHTKSAEQGLELTNQSVGINFYGGLKILSRGLWQQRKASLWGCENLAHPHIGKPTALVAKHRTQEGFQERWSCTAWLPLGQEPESPGVGLAPSFAGPIAKLNRRAFHSEL